MSSSSRSKDPKRTISLLQNPEMYSCTEWQAENEELEGKRVVTIRQQSHTVRQITKETAAAVEKQKKKKKWITNVNNNVMYAVVFGWRSSSGTIKSWAEENDWRKRAELRERREEKKRLHFWVRMILGFGLWEDEGMTEAKSVGLKTVINKTSK